MKINQSPSAKSARLRYLFLPLILIFGIACNSTINTQVKTIAGKYIDYTNEVYSDHQSSFWTKKGAKNKLQFYFPKGFKGYFQLLSPKLSLNAIKAQLQFNNQNSNLQDIDFEQIMDKYHFEIRQTGTYILEVDNSKSLEAVFVSTHLEKTSLGIDKSELISAHQPRFKSISKNINEIPILMPVFSMPSKSQKFKLQMQAGKTYWFSIKNETSKHKQVNKESELDLMILSANGKPVSSYRLKNNISLIYPCEISGEYEINTHNARLADNLQIEYQINK